MATGIFQSRNGRSRRNSIRAEADNIEDQLAQIRDDIAALAKVVARDASSGVSEARSKLDAVREKVGGLKGHAEADFRDLIASGEEILSDIRARYRDSGRHVRETVKEHPLATIGTAVAAGFILAALLRR
ncbi:MAG: hypothetical protein QHC90_15010 [Shinella sp.]|jgi:ElaB/YqjD/DUF883 family membrane-anchored ribosome-binding protein|nr:hypothetical protein [Shinella sp.]